MFLIKRMQPKWLQTYDQRSAFLTGTWLLVGLLSGLLVGLLSGLLYGLAGGLLFGLVGGLVVVLFVETVDWLVDEQDVRDIKLVGSVEMSWLIMFVFLVGGLVFGLVVGLLFGQVEWLLFGLAGGLVGGLVFGGLAFIQHFILRLILWRNGYIPRDYVRFLDYAAEHIFLRKVGGGYIFIHRMLMEYFASLETQPSAKDNE